MRLNLVAKQTMIMEWTLMNFPWDQLLVKGDDYNGTNWCAIPSYWFNRSNYLLQVMEISLQRMVHIRRP